MGVKLSAISYYLPPNQLTNKELVLSFPDYSDLDIYSKTGIKVRYRTSNNIIASDLALNAAISFFDEEKYCRKDIEFLIFCTEGPDYYAPVTACIIHQKLGLNKNIGALDLPGGCAGFTNALGVAKALIENNQCNNVLMLFADTPSLAIRSDDFLLNSLFSDVASCVFMEKSKKNNIGNLVYGTDGEGASALFIDYSGIRKHIDTDWLEQNKDVGGMPYGQMKMDGLEVFSFSIKQVPILVQDILIKNNLSFEDVDLFVFHQASQIILKSLQRKLNIPKEKMMYNLENFGNTVSSTIPIALKEAEKQKKIKKGSKVLIAGFGIGFSWSGTILFY